MRNTSIAILMLICMIGTAARAQMPVSPTSTQKIAAFVDGKWSSGNCAEKFYVWQVVGSTIQFRDQSGKLDIERIIQVGQADFITVTTGSAQNPAGVRWSYTVTNSRTIVVKNLATGQTFTQSKCDAPATSAPVTSAQAAPSAATTAADSGMVGRQRSAEQFVRALYAPYARGRLSDLADARAPVGAAAQILEPSLANMWRSYSTKKRDSPGPINGDPICACQEAEISALNITATMSSPTDASVTAQFNVNASRRIVNFRLVAVENGWRVSDITSAPNLVSFRQSIQRDLDTARAAASPTAQPVYRTYTNARFGYSIGYPATYVIGREADNGDGISFTSSDQQIKISAFGSYNALEQTINEIARDADKTIIRADRASYTHFSFLDASGAHLPATALSAKPDTIAAVTIEFPLARRGELEVMAAAISTSLRFEPRPTVPVTSAGSQPPAPPQGNEPPGGSQTSISTETAQRGQQDQAAEQRNPLSTAEAINAATKAEKAQPEAQTAQSASAQTARAAGGSELPPVSRQASATLSAQPLAIGQHADGNTPVSGGNAQATSMDAIWGDGIVRAFTSLTYAGIVMTALGMGLIAKSFRP